MFYWVFEYGKVLAAYLFIMYLWPSIVFRNYLSKKGHAFRFAFCTTFMVLLLNTVILMLGIVKLLNPWVVRILFYGPLAYIAGNWLYQNRDKAIHIKYLLTDICSLKRFFFTSLAQIGKTIKDAFNKLINRIRPHLWVYIMLAVAVLYGMVYFSCGAFQEKYYGASDVYVHHSWIDNMMSEGRVFGGGIYPEGMHCFVYGMNALLGVEVYSCLLFLAGIHSSAFLVAAYVFFKEIFPWKFSGIFVIALFLILRLDYDNQVSSMSRLQWTIPQEFGMYTIFLCAAYLLRYLRRVSSTEFQWKKWRFCRDENLLIFLMALAVSIAIHFYVTIMAFFLCAAIGVFFLVHAFTQKKVVPIALAILCGLLIATIPMLTARATGIEFQGSINWALGVIEDSQEALVQSEEVEPTVQSNLISALVEVEKIEVKQDPQDDLQEDNPGLLYDFYNFSYARLYKVDRAVLLVSFTLFGLLAGGFCHFIAVKKREATVADDEFCGYLFQIMASLTFLTMYAAPEIGLLEIIDVSRLCSMTHMLTIAVVVIPLDLLMDQISKKSSRISIDVCAVVLCLGMCVSVVCTGNYHSYLYYYLTRYPAAAEMSNRIIREMEPESFTIVSATDELYQIKDYGYHEEIALFVERMAEESYTLPTKYVFLFIEKQPLVYSHPHLLAGPSLLAREDYGELFAETNFYSECPNVLHSEISEEAAKTEIRLPVAFSSYKNPKQRTILYSRMYQWAERFQELYPYQLNVVYEDEAFVCYMFEQNQERLLELAIMN